MKRFALILTSAVILLLSACGTSELPPTTETPPLETLPLEKPALEKSVLENLEISIPEIELPGCSLPALQDDLENFNLADCVFLGCIRYAAQ